MDAVGRGVREGLLCKFLNGKPFSFSSLPSEWSKLPTVLRKVLPRQQSISEIVSPTESSIVALCCWREITFSYFCFPQTLAIGKPHQDTKQGNSYFYYTKQNISTPPVIDIAKKDDIVSF